jgi:D-serine deaminase-like pyridoxal phosphate-dependent protein
MSVARRIAAAPQLRLAGVGGYEGALAHDRTEQSLQSVRRYLAALRSLHQRLRADGLLAGQLDDQRRRKCVLRRGGRGAGGRE